MRFVNSLGPHAPETTQATQAEWVFLTATSASAEAAFLQMAEEYLRANNIAPDTGDASLAFAELRKRLPPGIEIFPIGTTIQDVQGLINRHPTRWSGARSFPMADGETALMVLRGSGFFGPPGA